MVEEKTIKGWDRNEMAQKVALDIPDGSYVNLGIGIPELVADFVPEGKRGHLPYRKRYAWNGTCSGTGQRRP